MDDYLEKITEWWRSYYNEPNAVVTKCSTQGTDWDGSTEDGFHSTFNVHLTVKGSDRGSFFAVDGEQLGSLWDWVVAGQR